MAGISSQSKRKRSEDEEDEMALFRRVRIKTSIFLPDKDSRPGSPESISSVVSLGTASDDDLNMLGDNSNRDVPFQYTQDQRRFLSALLDTFEAANDKIGQLEGDVLKFIQYLRGHLKEDTLIPINRYLSEKLIVALEEDYDSRRNYQCIPVKKQHTLSLTGSWYSE